MHLFTIFLTLIPLLSFVSASAIPVRRIKVSSDVRLSTGRRQELAARHARLFHKRQDPSLTDVPPYTIVLTPAAESTIPPVATIVLTPSSDATTLSLDGQSSMEATSDPGSVPTATRSTITVTATSTLADPNSIPTVTPFTSIATTTNTFTDSNAVSTVTSSTFADSLSTTSDVSSEQTSSSTQSDSTTTQATSSTINPVSQPTQPPVTSDGPRKYVVAHHMVGNTFPYTLQDWLDDINLAHSSGIDGFALNMGIDSWQPARVADAYQAAAQSNLDFKLFLSLDMSSFPCASPNDAETLRNLVNTYLSHPNQLQYDSKAFVSTFAGESCQFGQGSTADGWRTQFTQSPDLQGKISFVPSFFIDPATFKDFDGVMDGSFNFNGGWPIQVTTSFAQNTESSQSANTASKKSLFGLVTGAPDSAATTSLEGNLESAVASVLSPLQLSLSQFIGATDTDNQQRAGLGSLSGQVQARDDGTSSKKAYMTAVSPWFFTHYGPDSFNKNFVFLADQHLYAKRWDSLIETRDQIDIVEIVTWNDYGESHYIGPIKGSQPNSQAWTDGMDHTAWLDMTQYYATAFKTGQYPTIEKDKIYMWSRPHSNHAQTPDSVPQPTNFEILQDAVWAVVMTTAPSTVVLTTSPTNSLTFQVPVGVSKLAVPITPGGTMNGVIQRNGQTVVELSPSDFTFQGSPQAYNFNAFVASATAP